VRDRQRDHATRSVTIGRIYVRRTAVQPNNNSKLIQRVFINRSSAVAEMGDRLATIGVAESGDALLWGLGPLGPHLTQCGLG